MKKLFLFITLSSTPLAFSSAKPDQATREHQFMQGSLNAQQEIAAAARAQQGMLDSIVTNQQEAAAAAIGIAQDIAHKQLAVTDQLVLGVKGIEAQLRQTNLLLALLIKSMNLNQEIPTPPSAIASTSPATAAAPTPLVLKISKKPQDDETSYVTVSPPHSPAASTKK